MLNRAQARNVGIVFQVNFFNALQGLEAFRSNQLIFHKVELSERLQVAQSPVRDFPIGFHA